MTVGSKDELQAKVAGDAVVSFYGVMRCLDQPLRKFPPAIAARVIRTTCSACREFCWLDPVSYVAGTVVRCLPCLPDNLEFHAAAEAVVEVTEAIGRR